MTVIELNPDELTPAQLLAAEYLATPGKGGFTMEEIATEIGTSARTIQRWRQQPAFAAHLKARTLEIVRDRLPNIFDTVAARAEQGSAKHAELILKATGMLKEHHIHQPLIPDDSRSNARIEAEIERLRQELGEI